MQAILKSIAQQSNSPAFKRSFALILVAEALTILIAWVLIGVNMNGWLHARSMKAVQISQAAAAAANWSRIDEIRKNDDSSLFESYRKTMNELSDKFFHSGAGEVYVVIVKDGEAYENYPDQPYPMQDLGKATPFELAAYATKKTTYNAVPHSDSSGTYLGAFTPIVRNGNVIGLVSAEFDTATLDDFRGIVRKAFWYSVIPAIVLSLLVAYALAARFVDPMEVFRRIDETARETVGEEGAGPLAALSSREMEVAELVRQGLSYKEIGTALDMKFETVKHHMKNIKEKTGFNKVDLAVHLEATRQHRP